MFSRNFKVTSSQVRARHFKKLNHHPSFLPEIRPSAKHKDNKFWLFAKKPRHAHMEAKPG